jgi:hypothetical protein
MMLCAVCTVHKETRSADFLVLARNQGQRVSQFGPQNQQLRFINLGLKITATVSWFRPQNHAGDGLSIAPQNQRKKDSAGHASRSSGLVRLEASRARVS